MKPKPDALFFLGLLATLLTLWQVVLPVPARGEITLDGTLGPAGPLAGPDYAIPAGLGTKVGGNLFHSFGEFNLSLGESATFSGPGSVRNIIARVTGGHESGIDGLLRSTIPGADLFLLNPKGVIFGPHASLDLQGSFHITTADYLALGNEGRFAALHPEDSELTADPPAAFGFLSNAPAGISFYGSGSADAATYLPWFGYNGDGLTVQEGKTISVVGGDIQLRSGYLFDDQDWAVETRLLAPGGRINLVGVASAGELSLDSMTTGGFAQLGDITIAGQSWTGDSSRLDVSGEGGGAILIRGNQLVIEGGKLLSETSGTVDGQGIDIITQGSCTLQNGGMISSKTSGIGQGGDISLKAETVTLSNNAGIDLSSSGAGTGGSIDLKTTALKIDGKGSYINAATFADGDGGSIAIETATLDIANGGQIWAATTASGKGGNIQVTARDAVRIDGAGSYISATTFADGEGGSIAIEAKTLDLSSGGQIWAATAAGGKGGTVRVMAREAVSIADVGSYINAETFGNGEGGSISIKAKTLDIVRGGQLWAATAAGGKSGNIRVAVTDAVNIADPGSYINADTFADGEGGSISIEAATLDIADGGQVSADVNLGASGNGGTIQVTATDAVSIAGAGSYISASTFADGDGGSISITAANRLHLSQGGSITTSTSGRGDGGNLSIHTADKVTLDSGGGLTSSSTGTGRAGTIEINAGRTFFSNQGRITAEASNAGGGDISLMATDRIHLVDSKITTSVRGGEGDGGNITIDPQYVILDHSRIVANAWGGNGGNIQLSAGTFIKDQASLVSASSALGIDGVVTVDSPANDVAGALAVLPTTFRADINLASDSCAARTIANNSSLVLEGDSEPLPGEGLFWATAGQPESPHMPKP